MKQAVTHKLSRQIKSYISCTVQKIMPPSKASMQKIVECDLNKHQHQAFTHSLELYIRKAPDAARVKAVERAGNNPITAITAQDMRSVINLING